MESSYEPLVSVIVPNYNHAKYVGDCVQSILNQTYPHVEVIVVDDGSTDDSLLTLKPFENRIQVIAQQNTGLPGARNSGIRQAKGELLAFLDADDRWLPDKLAIQVPLFQAPTVAFVHSAARFFRDDGLWDNVQFYGIDVDFHSILNYQVLSLQTALIRRTVLDDVGLFDPEVRGADDWDMMLRISAKYPILGIEACLAEIRCVDSSMSRAPKFLKWKRDMMYVSQLKVVNRHAQVHPNCGVCKQVSSRTRQAIRSYYYGNCRDLAISAWKQRSYMQALLLYGAAFKYDPRSLPTMPFRLLKKLARI